MLTNLRETWIGWESGTLASLARVIAGQDLKGLAPYVDDFGPTCYIPMLGRAPEWVDDVANDYFRETRKPPHRRSWLVGRTG